MDEVRLAAKRGRFGKIIWWIGVLATAALVAALAQGFSVRDAETLRPHLYFALTACLVILFSHLWIGIYLQVLRREVHRYRESSGNAGGEEIPKISFLWIGAPVALVLASFFMGPLGLQGTVPYRVHSILGFLALGAQAAGLWAEKRDLLASDRILGGLYAREARENEAGQMQAEPRS